MPEPPSSSVSPYLRNRFTANKSIIARNACGGLRAAACFFYTPSTMKKFTKFCCLAAFFSIASPAFCQLAKEAGESVSDDLPKSDDLTDVGAAAEQVAKGNSLMQEARDKGSHDFSKAEACYLEAIKIDPESTDAMLGMAWVKNSQHLFEQGRGWAEKALAFAPKLVDAHCLLGDYALELGSYDEAFEHYQTAIDQKPDLSTYSRAAHLLWETGDSGTAQVLMEKAIASGGPFPENLAWCGVELALMQFHLGSTFAAEMQTKKALEVSPANPRALAMMGRVLTSKGDYVRAMEFYRKSVSVTPSHQALSAIVDLHNLLGEKDQAALAIKDVVSFHRRDPEKSEDALSPHGHPHPLGAASAELADFMVDHNVDLPEALKEAEKAYETYKNIRVEDTIAWCQYKLKNYRNARLMIERAMRWKTQDPSLSVSPRDDLRRARR